MLKIGDKRLFWLKHQIFPAIDDLFYPQKLCPLPIITFRIPKEAFIKFGDIQVR